MMGLYTQVALTVEGVYSCTQLDGDPDITCADASLSVAYTLFASTVPWDFVYTPASTIKKIPNDEFRNANIKSLVLSSSITDIYYGAFANNQITSVDLGGVILIYDGAFAHNNILNLTLPATVRMVQPYAFSDNNITDLTLNEGLLYLGSQSFAFNRITHVALPASLRSTGGFADYNSSTMTYDENYIEVTGSAFMGQSANNNTGVIYRDISLREGCPESFYTSTYVWPEINMTDYQACQDFMASDFWYVTLTTADPANPMDFKDYAASFAGKAIGGHLINAASVILNFTDGSGNALQAPKTFTGRTSGGNVLGDYIVTNGPAITTFGAQDTPIVGYYRIGDTFTYTAPTINGLAPTPASYSFVLGDSTTTSNSKTFVYGASSTSGGLANTGLNSTLIIASAIVAIIVSLAILVRQKLCA